MIKPKKFVGPGLQVYGLATPLPIQLFRCCDSCQRCQRSTCGKFTSSSKDIKRDKASQSLVKRYGILWFHRARFRKHWLPVCLVLSAVRRFNEHVLHEASTTSPHCPQSHRMSYGFLSYIVFIIAVPFLLYIPFMIIWARMEAGFLLKVPGISWQENFLWGE